MSGRIARQEFRERIEIGVADLGLAKLRHHRNSMPHQVGDCLRLQVLPFEQHPGFDSLVFHGKSIGARVNHSGIVARCAPFRVHGATGRIGVGWLGRAAAGMIPPNTNPANAGPPKPASGSFPATVWARWRTGLAT